MSRLDIMDADVLHAFLFETLYEVVGRLKQELEFDDQLPMVHNDLGVAYCKLYQYDKAIPELKKALEIYNHWGVRPYWSAPYTVLGFAYHKTSQNKKEKKVYKKAVHYFPESTSVTYRQAILSLTESDTIEGNKYIKKYIALLKERSQSEAAIITRLASIYSEANILDKAEKYHRQALMLEPENLGRMNDLAYFLIDKDRNITEGLGLVETALKSSSDDNKFLHTKGWGLYKQGTYQEALDVLQKSWDLRMKNAIYNHDAYLHLEAAKKAVANQKNN